MEFKLKSLIKKYVTIKKVIVAIAFTVGLGAYLVSKTPDGMVEQAAEAVLRTQGIDVDLSPDEK